MIQFVRVAAVTPDVQVANPQANAKNLLHVFEEATHAGATIVVAPELAMTGYTCGDLFGTQALEQQLESALTYLIEHLPDQVIVAFGLPIRWEDRLYNCAAIAQRGRLLGLVPKTYLPTYREFYEKRHFVSGRTVPEGTEYLGVPFGTDLLFETNGLRFGVEICEDLWAVDAPSNRLAAGRAHLVLNLSASTEAVGKASYRRDLVRMQSGRLVCAYAYAAAGCGESTTDVVYGGHRLLANNGHLLAEARWTTGISLMDFNPQWIDVVRQRETSFPELSRPALRHIVCGELPMCADGSLAGLETHPFVPKDDAQRLMRCQEILQIQVTGLIKRLRFTHAERLVLGLSGGLDSTLALLVCVRACQAIGKSPSTILAVTMPGFGTTKRTLRNAEHLAEHLGAELRTISIIPEVEQHFRDINHDPKNHDITYENAQARARTYILMDLANQTHGLLIGTGDLSEIALGWSTYNGDHMSMYAVNCGVPKTLVKWCIHTVAQDSNPTLAGILSDICDTPISPELLPEEQHTEAIVGQYELHDFFLYYFLKYGCARTDLETLAIRLLGHMYTKEIIHETLTIFCRRFVLQQYKRSAIPDGPKVGTIALSPRGDWRMPSDADFSL